MIYLRVLFEGEAHWAVQEGDFARLLRTAPYEVLDYDGRLVPLSQCKLLAPAQPTKIVCVGKNYRDHAMEMGGFVPQQPILFLKGPNTLNHPDCPISAPDFVTRLDYECELAFVVKKRAKNVRAEDFADYVLGYTCLNDVTARDIQSFDGQWTRAKSMDGFCPVGPVLTDEVDPSNLTVTTRLNGVVKQQGNTCDFLHPMGDLFAFITASMTLEAGDLVTTGTPAGIGPMEKGDVVEVEVENIGILRNFVE
ncbi:MAG: fumarylacetoacetate hydrolase family protein [Oscillospiraceae bacterium]|nr:fumarylacetoacetate hydrolase family protein [Oscillospiraceae bacterium]